MDLLNKEIFREVLIIFSLSLIVAFSGNFLSSNGISLFGQWDTATGVITANPEKLISSGVHEIDDISEVISIYEQKLAVFVDARDISDYTEGHIKGAVSFPINDFENGIAAFMEKYKPSERIVAYCSGRECEDSHILSEYLYEEGYTNISVFIDGYFSWEKNGLPIESD